MAELMVAPRSQGRANRQVAIGLNEDQRSALAEILNTLLADETLLYVSTRSCHWNVTGMHFHHLHQLFQEQYEQLAEMIDEIAERIRALDATAMGTLQEYLLASRLEECRPPERSVEMIAGLLQKHEAIVRNLRGDLQQAEELGDMGTSDFLTGLMERHEKLAWMLRASLDR